MTKWALRPPAYELREVCYLHSAMGRLQQLFLWLDMHEYIGDAVYPFENSGLPPDEKLSCPARTVRSPFTHHIKIDVWLRRARLSCA